MATIDSGEHSSFAGVRVTGQTLLLVGFTLVETLALGLWLTLVQGAPLISAGQPRVDRTTGERRWSTGFGTDGDPEPNHFHRTPASGRT